jgi:hypothetical protein
MNANKLTRKVTAKMLRIVAHDATYPSRCLLTYNDSYNVDRYGITQSEAAVIRRALVDICGSIGVGRSYSSVTVREINQRLEQLHGFSTK